MKPKNGAKATPKQNSEINGVPRETYLHWLEVVFNEIGWEAAASLLELNPKAALRYLGGTNVPLVDSHLLERAYVAYRSMQFDLSPIDMALYKNLKREHDRNRVIRAVEHQAV